MQRKWKITLAISIAFIVVLGGLIGGLYLNSLLRKNGQSQNNDPPVLLFPIANLEVLERFYGFNWTATIPGHNGIDFIINETATVIASCNMTCNDKSLIFNEIGNFWQAGCSFDINDDYELFYAFESLARNETFGTIQLNVITVEVGQVVTAGEVIGELFRHEDSAHIHYMLHKKNEPVCPYLYFSPEAKNTFDVLWTQFGHTGCPCNSTG